MAYIDTERIPMISEILRTARHRALIREQQAASLVRPKGYVAPDPPYLIEGLDFGSSQTEDEECDPDDPCDDPGCVNCHSDCAVNECPTCHEDWIDQAEREADFAREME